MVTLVSQPLPDKLAGLQEIALDLRWTWSHEADALWDRIAPKLWEQTRSPGACASGLAAEDGA